MTPRRRRSPHLSLPALLHELQHRMETQPFDPEQEPALMALAMKILSCYAKDKARPLPGTDLGEIRGQAYVKRALEVTAAGGHNLLLIGPNGAGKAMLARTLPSLLKAPGEPLPFHEVHGGASSSSSLFGERDTPGEVTLAHGGVLLIKELGLCSQTVLSALSQLVETRVLKVDAEKGGQMLPATFQLVATLLPCPCGFLGDPVKACGCSTETIKQYWQRLRKCVKTCFDLEVNVPILSEEILLHKRPGESSAQLRSSVEEARARQASRYAGWPQLRVNADLRSIDLVEQHCQREPGAGHLLRAALSQLHLTPGEGLRVQRVARTIADLAACEVIYSRRLAEALQYLDRS